jgi:MOSC domain-containing protein YiiM
MTEQSEIRCLAGRGVEGDRFLDFKPDYKGQITFFSEEVYLGLCEALGVWDKSPAVLRRNVLTSGADLNELIGCEFEIQGVLFSGAAEASPCYWMDQAFCPGAETFLKGRGGLRARIVRGGVLRAEVGDPNRSPAPG